MTDEIIAEVCAIKEAIGARYNYDLRSLYADIKQGELELEAKGVHIVPPPSDLASLPNSALQRTRFAHRRI